ncbi:MAG: UMP kinase [Gammaproteobacteria bacterium]|nr:UMP kinase [Gammaproteobacteria bacterium]
MNNNKQAVYKRILLKLSGEALMGKSKFGIDPTVIEYISKEIAAVLSLGVEVGVVIGGGNFFRGKALFSAGLDRITGDNMGTVATIINALAMRDIFERHDISALIMSAIPMSGIVEHYDRRRAIHKLASGNVVIFAAGTGNPLVTTDSALSLRGIEIEADILLKATNVDGIYTADPALDPKAKRYSSLTYKEVLSKELAVMDLAAFSQCRDYNMILRVFNLHKKGALLRIVLGEDEGTLVTKDSQVDNS